MMGSRAPATPPLWGPQRCQDLWGDERAVDYRLAMLGRKLDEVTLRVNSGLPATTAIDEVKNRVVVLENEKMKLLDENTALKIENAKLKGLSVEKLILLKMT